MAKIVAVHSFRGGTGKSNITANLAAIAAERGNRVGIVDTDIQSPGIHVLFGLDEEHMHRALNDYLWGRCPIEDAAYDVSPPATRDRGSISVIHLIPSSIRAGEIAKVLREGYDVGLLNEGFQQLIRRLHLDYLFIDTHPGINEETLLSITIADLLVVILRPDRQDYQGTAVTVEVARRLEVPAMVLVVNKVLPSYDFAEIREQMSKTYDVPVAGVLPLSEEVVRLASSDLFYLRFPDDPWSQELVRIAGAILA